MKSVTPLFPDIATADHVREQFTGRTERYEEEPIAPLLNWQTIEFTEATDVLSLVDHFRKDRRVQSAELSRFYETSDLERIRPPKSPPTDPFLNSSGTWGQSYPDLWGLRPETFDAVGAWPVEDGDRSIIIAVSDTGLDYTHEDISANVWQNRDELLGDGNGDACPGVCGTDDDADGLIDEDSAGCGANGRMIGGQVCTYLNDLDADDDENGYIDDARGYDFTTCQRYLAFQGCVDPKPRDADPMDGNGHGTHVAGTIAAIRNNNRGIAGVCPSCTVMPVKGLNDQGAGESDDLAQSIYYAVRNGADVINMSWGGYGTDPVIEDALDYAHAAGVWLVVAAGNSNDLASRYFPASYPWAMTIAATDTQDRKASFSNWGDEIDVAAPGVDILSLRAGNVDPYGDRSNFAPVGDPSAKYMRLSGTSMAAPHIAGLMGLVLAKNLQDPIYRISGGAEDVNNDGYDLNLGNGRSNAKISLTFDDAALKLKLSQPNRSIEYFTRGSQITVRGTAAGTSFASYTLEFAQGWTQNPSWQQIVTSSTPADDGTGGATLGTWNTGTLIGKYVLRLTVRGTDGTSRSEVNTVFIGVSSGWPRTPDTGFPDRAALVDIDPAVPGQEIVYPYDSPNSLRGLRGNGTPLAPVLDGAPYSGAPTFANLDQDAQLEIVSVNRGPSGSDPFLRVLNADGSSVPGFPVRLPTLPNYTQQPTTGCPSGFCPASYQLYSTSVDDIDNDGDLEIAVPVGVIHGAGSFGRLLLYDHQGNALLESEDPAGYTYRTDGLASYSIPPAFGNLDGDTAKELVLMDDFGWVRAFNLDGSPVSGWPTWSNTTPASGIVLADLGGDLRHEVIAVSPYSWNIQIWNGDGSRWGHSPYGTLGQPSNVAVVDVDYDGTLEVVVRSSSYLSVLRRNGVQAEHFPARSFFGGSSGNSPLILEEVNPTLAGAEVIWNDTASNLVMATQANGRPVTTAFPFVLPNSPTSPPLVGDVTGDGLQDVVVATGWADPSDPVRLYLFELGTPFNATRATWPTRDHDLAQTKRADCPECRPAESRPYDSRQISCDQKPETPACDRGAFGNAACGTYICQADCTCTTYVEQQTGWPQIGDIFNHSAVRAADIDADGTSEVLFNNVLLHADGSAVPGFPLLADPTWNSGSHTVRAMGNIDADPEMELVAQTEYQTADYQFRLRYALVDHHGATVWANEIPQTPPFDTVQPVGSVIADILPGSPGKEVIGIVQRQRQAAFSIELHVWEDDGTPASGFPINIPGTPVSTLMNNDTIAVGDIDGDGTAEIVVNKANQWNPQDGWTPGSIIAVNHDGTIAWEKTYSALDPGLPVTHTFFSIPSLGDVDPSTTGKEIIAVEETYPEAIGKVYVLNGANGEPVRGWPMAFGPGDRGNTSIPPVVADLDGDGALEIAAAGLQDDTGGRLFVFEHTGTMKAAWPVGALYYGQDSNHYLLIDRCRLTAADVDGDGKPELILCGDVGDGKAWAFNEDATQVANWPMYAFSDRILTTPTVADLDEDGDVELLLNSNNGLLYAYDLPGQAWPSNNDWKMDRYDAGNSGASDFVPTSGARKPPVEIVP